MLKLVKIISKVPPSAPYNILDYAYGKQLQKRSRELAWKEI